MGRITIELEDGLEKKFRAQIAMKYGGKKGAIGKAVEEAVELWLEQEKEK